MKPDPSKKAEELYRAALEREPVERDAFLEKACGGDEALLDEVKSRLVNTWVGRRVQNYEVLSLLGAGGMGEVYRAKDTKLGREVALKVLSEEFAEDPERVTRFEREARLLAALNHPNVAAIHGLEKSEGRHVLVLELVEGETLAERIARGPIPISEALPLFRQIAAGLEAAHEKGIVHRDLKPSNVTVTPEGQVKVLDFGLAKAFRGVVAAGSDVRTETAWDSQTGEGRIVGTVSYMSPEQARGLAVDKRTDVWAFGCVLYEALTGRRAFAGGTVSDTLAAVLDREVDWARLPPGTPAGLRSLLRRCLQKDRDRRLHDVADARIEIEEALAELSQPAVAGLSGTTEAQQRADVRARAGPRRWGLWIGAAAVLGAAAGAAGLLVLETGPVLPPVSRFPVRLPPEQTLVGGGHTGSTIAVSRDGRHIVYVARHGATTQLYHRAIDALEAEAISGTERARAPFFSPDGSSVGFHADGALKKILVRGGTSITVADIAHGAGYWGRDDAIVWGACNTGITRIAASGGQEERLTRGTTPQHQSPQVLPSRNAVLHTQWHALDDLRIAVLDLETGEERVVIERGTRARYVPTGHVIYAWAGDLWAAPFDLGRLEATGPPVNVVEDVLMERARGAAHFDVSEEGTLVYLPGGLVDAGTRLAWAAPSGAVERLPVADVQLSPRVSPDGARLLFHRLTGGNAIWIHDLARNVERKLTTEDGLVGWAAWVPNGESVVFAFSEDFPRVSLELFRKPADSSLRAERLTEFGGGASAPYSFSADGEILAFVQTPWPEPGSDIWTLSMVDDGKPRPFLRERFAEFHPALSPNGKWMAHASDDSGRTEVSVRPYPGPGGVIRISSDGGWEPIWSPDGKTLYHRDLTGQRITAVPFDTAAPVPRPGRPRVVVEGPFEPGNPYGRRYDLAPDGRFLVIVQDEPPTPTEYHVVLNWFEELERLVPTN